MAEIAMGFSIQLESRRSECDRLYRFLEESLAAPEFTGMIDEETVSDLKVVAEELFANTVFHGYGEGAKGSVEIDLSAMESGICLVLTDSAPPFSPFERIATITPEQDLSHGGMGLTLIRTMTDEQHYTYENGRNVIRLLKHKTTD